jgi:hypothetical protein
MAGHTDQQPPQAGTPVPDLIERYRLRRDAWIAQADELARLRDEVRSSAEREAMEIVTTARRDVRKVIMEARRELLVLSAQVQAALGEVTGKTDPATLLTKAGITTETGVRALHGTADVFAPEDAVNEILNEVQEDMTALAEDARAFPLESARQIASASQPLASPQAWTPPAVTPSRAPVPPPDITSVLSSSPEPDDVPELDVIEFHDTASQVLLSSQFPSDAVPVRSGKRLSTFVGVFVGVGVLVVSVTIWWLSGRSSRASESASPAATAAPAQPANSAVAKRPLSEPGSANKASTKSGNLSLVAEAVRDVWVRTTIDGRTEDGRTLAAGQVIDVSAEQSIVLRVGDAGAIVVSVNHGEKRPLGFDGQVVTRQFVVEKSEAPAPAPTPLPPNPKPDPPASGRPAPPIASSTPVFQAPSPRPAPATAGLAAPPSPPPPTAAAQAAPAPSVNQLVANGSPAPGSVVNQLSVPPPSPPAAAIPAAPTGGSPATVVVAIARQWLDAYHRQDRSAMAALSTDNLLLADERRSDERFPPGLTDVTRTLDRVSVQIAADTAVLTAVMMEQSGTAPSPHVSPISQVWVLGGGQWKVRQARFVSEARLNQVFK